MSAVSELIVREYFELHGFFVRQQRKHQITGRGNEEGIDFLVINPRYAPAPTPKSFVLSSADLQGIRRAIVEVRGWHTEVFGPGVLSRAPKLFRFAESKVVQPAFREFGPDGPLSKIMVVPALPRGARAKDESIQLLRNKGVDAVIPFRTILSDLVSHVQTNRNYSKSDLLQIIRILKNYGFITGAQLELFRSARRRQRRAKSTRSEA